MITLKQSGELFDFEHMFFPAGENHVKLPIIYLGGEDYDIELIYTNDTELFQLAHIVNAIRNWNVGVHTWISLSIPYFPGCRQDRVCVGGEPFSLEVYTDFVNSLNFDLVTIFDPHSEVLPALLNNVCVEPNHFFVLDVLDDVYNRNSTDIVLISPDAGSNKKIYKLTQYLSKFYNPTVIRADKIRDVTDGKILETVVYCDDLNGKTVFIVDDICSYGGTFRALAAKLKEKNAGDIHLVVSHNECVCDIKQMKDSGITSMFFHNDFGRKDQWMDRDRTFGIKL